MKKMPMLALGFLACLTVFAGPEPATAQLPDFAIIVPSNNPQVPEGGALNLTIALTSLNGYSGNVSLLASVPSPESWYHALSLGLDPAKLSVSRGLPLALARLTIMWKPCQMCATYAGINITATDGSTSHQAIFYVLFPSFFLSIANCVEYGYNGYSCRHPVQIAPNSTFVLYVDGNTPDGYNGTVSIIATVSPPGPTVTPSSSQMWIKPIEGGEVKLTVSANNAPNRSYTVNVRGTNGYVSDWVPLDFQIGVSVPAVTAVSPNYSIVFVLLVGSVIGAGVALGAYLIGKRRRANDLYAIQSFRSTVVSW